MAEDGGVRVEDEQQFRDWLERENPSREICVALAARAALRVLPLLVEAHNRDRAHPFAALTAAVFRATALARVAGKYPTRTNDLAASAASAASAADAAAVDAAADAAAAARAAAAAAAYAADAAAAAAYTVYSVDAADPAVVVRDAAGDAARDAARAAAAAHAFWSALTDDLRSVEAGGAISDRPLWQDGAPGEIAEKWRALADALPREDHWRVWIDWYEARLKGEVWNEARELIYASAPKESWKDPAAANAWIKEQLRELDKAPAIFEPPAPAEEVSPEVLDLPLPPPVENVPSVFTYGPNASGQIDITAGPQNIPFIAHPGDEETHRRWLEAARKLAERLAKDLRSQKFNANPQYRERLEQYADDLPTTEADGNIILADAEARALHQLFAAEASALNEGFAARLRAFLETHFALLAFYEDEMRRFHGAAGRGSLDAPFPTESVAKVEAVVKAHAPEVFAPRVAEGLKEAERAAPKVELEPDDLRINAPIQPPGYPFGDADYEKARRLGVVGSINALYKAILERAEDPEKFAAMIVIAKEFYSAGEPIFKFLKDLSGQ